jgi:hypothetical protein
VDVRPRLVFLAIPLLVLAGCGGGGKTYDADKSRKCMEDGGFAVTDPPPSDLVATAAEGGAYTIHVPGQIATVSFGNDRDGAERIVRAYQHFNINKIALEDALKVRSNAVILFGAHPSDKDISTIEGCLK